ncbi:MAG TPA: tautomerase family protein [Pyrinomonadaceae bacterium]
MPFVNVKVIEGVFSGSQKEAMVKELTDAMVRIEGENMRQVTWVVIEEVKLLGVSMCLSVFFETLCAASVFSASRR